MSAFPTNILKLKQQCIRQLSNLSLYFYLFSDSSINYSSHSLMIELACHTAMETSEIQQNIVLVSTSLVAL